jgi:hypothetical protein
VVHRAGARGWFRQEGSTYIRISRDGLRDRDHPRDKPPGTWRIAVLGDSYAEAFQVRQEEAFWSVLERELNRAWARTGLRAEAINFGVSGYGTAQEYLTLQHRVWAYRPDLVLLALNTGNDILNNSRELNQDERMPYFRLEGGDLGIDPAFQEWYRGRQGILPRFYRRIRDHSRVVQAVGTGRYALERRIRATRQQGLAAVGGFDEVGLPAMIYREPADRAWREAWAITERLLVQIRDEARAHRVPLMVVTLSNGIQVHPDPAVRDEFRMRIGAQDLFYPDRRIRDFGERHGIRVLNLAPQLQERAHHAGIYLHGTPEARGTGHWNREGHRLAGVLLAMELGTGGKPLLQADQGSDDRTK